MFLCLALAACGGGDALTGEDEERIDRAADRMAQEDSYEADLTFDVDAGPQSLSLNGHVRGTNDQSKSAFDGTMDLPDIGEVNVEFVGVGDDVFIKGDGKLGEQIPAGKEWLRAGAGTQPLGFDEFLDFLRAGDEFENRGEEDIDGKATVHYGGPIDLQALAEAGGESDLAEQFAGTDFEGEVDVWIDEDDLPAQMEIDFDIEAQGESAEFEASITGFVFGTDVGDITAPPAQSVAGGGLG